MNIYTVSENGFAMDSDKVQIPACKIKADSFIEAKDILDEFLNSKIKPDSLELITPIERIDFN